MINTHRIFLISGTSTPTCTSSSTSRWTSRWSATTLIWWVRIVFIVATRGLIIAAVEGAATSEGRWTLQKNKKNPVIVILK